MITKLKLYAWFGTVLVLGGLLAYQTLRLHDAQLELGRADVAAAAQQQAASEALAVAEQAARAKESQLQTEIDDLRGHSNAQITTLLAQRDALLARVRTAEARARAAVPVPSTRSDTEARATPSGDSGAELLGSLGSADVEEAARADLIRTHLLTCYRQYEAVRHALESKDPDELQ